MLFTCFFFFKQKTAYEMRISDWSSDVCSSDLQHPCLAHAVDRVLPGRQSNSVHVARSQGQLTGAVVGHEEDDNLLRGRRAAPVRSEEHTSELQSLMRISYAVFCLKKKNKTLYKKS